METKCASKPGREKNRDAVFKGKHTLKIYVVDPGVILDEIQIDLRGLKKAYSALQETKRSK